MKIRLFLISTLKVIGATIVFITISVLTYWGFYNGFYSPTINVIVEGGEYIVYKHNDAGCQNGDSIMRVIFHELYDHNGIIITKGFAKYYIPTTTSGKRTLIEAGCIIENKDTSLVKSFKLNYEKLHLQVTNSITSDFPLKGQMSILLGMKKVYPILDEYCEKNGYRKREPVIEIYDRIEKKIHYRRELVRE